MSYTIEYSRIFLQSAEGFTPCWLSGDNNLYESSRKNAKRVRSWSCFQSLLGVTENEIFDSLGGRDHLLQNTSEYWRKGGKTVDGSGVVRWIQNGCRRAVTLEEILALNHMTGIVCSIYRYGVNVKSENFLYCMVHTTEEFDQWIRRAKQELQKLKLSGECGYPRISLPENMCLPTGANLSVQDEVFIKNKGMYLCELNPNESSWNRDVKKAMKLTKQQAMDLIADYKIPVQGRIISANNKNQPYNAVIEVVDGTKSVLGIVGGAKADCYVYKVTSHSIRFTNEISRAKKYANEKSAYAAIERIKNRGYSVGPDLRVKIL